ncbi:hypothetical protein HPG69_002744 [Diceros bicornis minor]|uniref:Pyrin domain-containing protein n=1 Tax=Diceros bicornis minor TaxID=77932 RepID=A0A7J7FLM9_DICBM|nr:hypothetical protein HPG69_002744 [Diceros bicornis minor]
MVNACKRTVLLKGLEPISDYHFSMVKSLLADDLKLTTKTQKEYNKIQIADLMAVKFQGAACVVKLIELYKHIGELKELVKILKNEKLKVAMKMRKKVLTPLERRSQEAAGAATPAPTTSGDLTSERAEETLVAQKRKNTTKENTGTKRNKVTREQIQPILQ